METRTMVTTEFTPHLDRLLALRARLQALTTKWKITP